MPFTAWGNKLRRHLRRDHDRNPQQLIDVAAEAGLDRQACEAMLNSEAGLEVIAQAGVRSQRHQVDCAPFFIVNIAIILSGAQAPETLLDAFKQATT